MTATEPITPVEYGAFNDAYDFFNTVLFAGSLPHVLVTLQRRGNSRGYFAPERFSGRTNNAVVHELALNPDAFTARTDGEILSTLVHEMVHVWQETYGKPGRGRYHNRQWANKMKEIGLYPSSTGAPGGKETGQRVTHYILPHGPYAMAFDVLEATGFQLHWQSKGRKRQPAKESKTKFTCDQCGLNAWGKPNALLICGACFSDRGEICWMLSASSTRPSEPPPSEGPEVSVELKLRRPAVSVAIGPPLLPTSQHRSAGK